MAVDSIARGLGSGSTTIANTALTTANLALLAADLQCRLVFTNSTTITLQQQDGNGLVINGALQTIPQAGVTLSNTGLTANTLYYIYAAMSGSTMILEASATSYTVDSSGRKNKTGDATRRLVGMAYMGAGTPGTFVNGQVASYANRKTKTLSQQYSAVTTTSTSLVAVGSAFTILTWGDEDTPLSFIGAGEQSAAGPWSQWSIGVDGSANITNLSSQLYFDQGAQGFNQASGQATASLSEGNHSVQLFISTSSGTVTYTGTIYASPRI